MLAETSILKLDQLSGFTIFLSVVFVILSILMVLIILVQRGRGGGLAGAFGSGGGGNTAFGTKTGDVFTTVTVVFFAIFILMAVYLNNAYKPANQKAAPPTTATAEDDIEKMIKEAAEKAATKPAATATSTAPATTATAPATMTTPTTTTTSAPAGTQPK